MANVSSDKRKCKSGTLELEQEHLGLENLRMGTRELDESREPSSDVSVGERLKHIRQRHGLSQRELARRANMTNGSLSNIEQCKVSPSVASLEKILSAFPMSLQEFFADRLDLAPSVFRLKDMVHIEKDNTEFHIMPLHDSGHESVYIARQIYHPGAKIKSEWMVHNGFVGGVVIDGALELNLEGVNYHLLEGEGFYFALSRSHVFTNASPKACTVVCVSFTQ